MQARELLLESYRAAVAAADPLRILPRHLPSPPGAVLGHTLVVGAGKAAASMAKAVEDHWPADKPLDGLVITRYHHGLPTKRIRVVEAGHPIPDESGERAAAEIFEAVSKLTSDDMLLALVSGGGSSLLSLPVDGLTMADLKAVTGALLKCGAKIQEINTVRKHLSRIQGGRLAAVCKAPIRALVISDVTGDDPTHIASGPCSPDPTTYADSLAILQHYGIDQPATALHILRAGLRGEHPETHKPGDPVFAQAESRVIATARASLNAAAEVFRAHGITPIVFGDYFTGESREVAKVFAAMTREVREHGSPWKAPVALISGGETTVTVRGTGRGGRCSEFLLSLAVELEGMSNVYALAADTDGIDGSEDNAGAILAPDSLERAQAKGVDAVQRLGQNDGYGFFETLDDLVVTGPTRTNVNDYRAILVR
jgi:glycerate 2-kinase